MRANGNKYKQIAVRSAVSARISRAAVSYALTVVDTRGDRYLELFRDTYISLARAVAAGGFYYLTGTVAVIARCGRLKHTERGTAGGLDLTAAVTNRACFGRCALLRAAAGTVGTFLNAVERNLLFAAEHSFLKGQRYTCLNIAALDRSVSARAAAAENAAEQITEVKVHSAAEAAEIKAAEAACSAAARRIESVKAVLIVYRLFLFVRQDRIRLVDFLKLLLGILIARIHIRVIFFCHCAIRFFYFCIRGALLNTEHLVIISFISHITVSCPLLTILLFSECPLCLNCSKCRISLKRRTGRESHAPPAPARPYPIG